jgi:hypothetical protein
MLGLVVWPAVAVGSITEVAGCPLMEALSVGTLYTFRVTGIVIELEPSAATVTDPA